MPQSQKNELRSIKTTARDQKTRVAAPAWQVAHPVVWLRHGDEARDSEDGEASREEGEAVSGRADGHTLRLLCPDTVPISLSSSGEEEAGKHQEHAT